MTWADASYSYKKEIAIQNGKVAGDETDFPVLISVTDGDLADTDNGGHVQNSDGYDIVFYDSTETTLLKHEIELYTNTSGLLVYWVKIPSLSSTSDTIIYVYYGKTGVVADPSSTDTWNANFVLVYHMTDTSDSTSNSNDWVNDGADTSSSGKIEGCYDFVKANTDYGLMPAGIFPNNDFTIEVWSNWDGADGSYHMIFTTQDDYYFYLGITSSDKHVTYDKTTELISAGDASTNWEHIVCTKSSTVANDNAMFIDSVEEAAHGDTTDCPVVDGWSVLGAYDSSHASFTGQYWYNGLLDEIRFSSVTRSDNWITTTYNTQSSPSTFMTFGAEETPFKPRPTVAVGNPLVF